jgi:hypothetical protein
VWELQVPDERVNVKIKANIKYQIETGMPKDEWIKSLYIHEASKKLFMILPARIFVSAEMVY